MEQRNINFLKMTSGVIAGMESEKSVWEEEKEIADVYAEITTDYNKIESTHQSILGTDTTGYTEEKDDLFESITKLTFKLCCKMSAYAKRNKDYVLLPLVDLSLSNLQQGVESVAVERCSAIVEKATPLLPKLVTFKVTEAQLTTIKQKIKAYGASIDGRTTTSGNRTVSGSEISQLISNLKENLDTLDSMIEGMIDDEAFIARYKSWRRIIDYGKGKTLPNKTK